MAAVAAAVLAAVAADEPVPVGDDAAGDVRVVDGEERQALEGWELDAGVGGGEERLQGRDQAVPAQNLLVFAFLKTEKCPSQSF